MSLELALGNYLRLAPQGGVGLQVQNYHINETVQYNGSAYSFLPFGFSGLTANRRGDSSETLLAFPNNELSRAWGMDAIQYAWLAECWVVVLDPDTRAVRMTLTAYVGQVSGGSWSDEALTLRLDNILDAVGVDVPVRQLHAGQVGRLPVSAVVGF